MNYFIAVPKKRRSKSNVKFNKFFNFKIFEKKLSKINKHNQLLFKNNILNKKIFL